MEKGNNVKVDLSLRFSKLSIILVYNLGTILGWAIFYPLIPILMGYPQGMIELSRKIGVSYDLQYVVVTLITVIIGTIFLLFFLKGIGKWQKAVAEKDSKTLEKIRKKCISIPYTIFILQVTLVGITIPVILGLVTLKTGMQFSQLLKISTVVFSLFSLIAVFSLIFSKRLFTKILLKTYNGEGLQGRRVGIRNKIFLQIVPMFIVAILFTAVLGYARLMEEKGNVVYKLCKIQLSEIVKDKIDFKSTNDLFEAMKKIQFEDAKIGYFALNKATGDFISSDGYVPGVYFKYFSQHPTMGDRVYGDSYDMQGVLTDIKINGVSYFAGVRFENASDKTINFFLIALFALLVLNIFVLYYLSKTLTSEISLVADSLNDIAVGEEVDLDRKLAVTSNDEIADLVVAFNKIQEREKEHIEEVKTTQDILAEQERLASLGQLIAGIAHNLRTPIMSISGGIEGLKDLINEYHEAIGDASVTDDDHYEIVKEMRTWIEKMRPYCTYMSDIITAVKEQTIQGSTEAGLHFTLEELEKRVDILLDHELRKRRCGMTMDFQILKSTKVQGEISNVVQVLNNLIVNAAHSYENVGGEIKIKFFKENNNVLITVSDTGTGIPKEVQEKLFKEMITTKGKKGTGLGLYMSYTNIKARFGGNLWFESEVGKGTTFYVSLPIK